MQVIGGLLIALAGYEAAAAGLKKTLISHARGLWRIPVIVAFGIFVGHVIVQWARDDAAARSAHEWRF